MSVVPFEDAMPGDDAYTYEEQPGPTAGEFGWVSHLEYFDDRSCDVRLIRKRWKLLEIDEIVLPDPYPPDDDPEPEQ